MASILEKFLAKVARRVADTLDGDSEPKTHPGRVHHARNVWRRKRKPKVREHRGGAEYDGNPHKGSWIRYTTHLFQLMLEGHGRSQAAMQVRDRLNFHWSFMTPAEHTECLNFYQQAKHDYVLATADRKVSDAQYERNVSFSRDIRSEVDEFMNPSAN